MELQSEGCFVYEGVAGVVVLKVRVHESLFDHASRCSAKELRFWRNPTGTWRRGFGTGRNIEIKPVR